MVSIKTYAAMTVVSLTLFVSDGGTGYAVLTALSWSCMVMLVWRRPEDCFRGACPCRSAANCAFDRCRNCDSPTKYGRSLDPGALIRGFDWGWCPDCGAPLDERHEKLGVDTKFIVKRPHPVKKYEDTDRGGDSRVR